MNELIMEILIGNFVACALYALIIYVLPINRRSKNKIFCTITFVQIVLIHGLVDRDVVPDLDGYYETFWRIAKNGLFVINDDNIVYSQGMEIGFKFWMWLVSIISGNFQFFLVANSALMIYLFYNCFNKYSPYVWYSVLLLLLVNYNQSIFVLRQHLSIAILMVSLPYIIRQDIKRFAVLILIACLIHKSALLFVPIYFLYGIKNNRLFFLALLSILIITPIALVPFVTRYGASFTRNEFFVENIALTGIAVKALIMTAIMIPYLFFLKGKVIEPGINRLVFIISFVGIVGNAFAGEAGEGRIFLAYYVIVLLQMPITLQYIKNRFIKSLYVLVSIAVWLAWAYALAGDVIYWTTFKLVI